MTDENENQGIPEPEGETDLIETEHDIGQDNIEGRSGPLRLRRSQPGLHDLRAFGHCLRGLRADRADASGRFFGWLRPALTSTFDWFFLSAANIFVLFCLC